MEGIDIKRDGLEILKKYRYVILILLIGLFFMLVPETSEKAQEPEPQAVVVESSLQTELSIILSKIAGAGNVEVLLTEASGSQTYYQADEMLSTDENTKDQRRDTVIVTNSSREETGLIRRVDPPVYQGAIVLCQGADDARVRLSIVEAVSNATGLTTNKITVLKMK